MNTWQRAACAALLALPVVSMGQDAQKEEQDADEPPELSPQ